MRAKTTPVVIEPASVYFREFGADSDAAVAVQSVDLKAPQLITVVSDLHIQKPDILGDLPYVLEQGLDSQLSELGYTNQLLLGIIINGDLIDRRILDTIGNNTISRERLIRTLLEAVEGINTRFSYLGINNTYVIFIPGNHEEDIWDKDLFFEAIRLRARLQANNSGRYTRRNVPPKIYPGGYVLLEIPDKKGDRQVLRIEHGHKYGSDAVLLVKQVLRLMMGLTRRIKKEVHEVQEPKHPDLHDQAEVFKQQVMTGALGRLVPFLLLTEIGPRIWLSRKSAKRDEQLLIIGHLHPSEFILTDRHNRFNITKRDSGLLVAQREGVLETPEDLSRAYRRLIAFFLRFLLPDNVLIIPYSGGKNMHIVLIGPDFGGQPTISLARAPFGKF